MVTCVGSAVSVRGQPASDDCRDAPIVIGEATVPFSNVGANTDGPSQCVPQGADVWVMWRSTSAGSARISTCTAVLSFDSALSVYYAAFDPNECYGNLIGCNDDDGNDCPVGGSTVRVPVRFGSCRVIQIGGIEAQEGIGEVVVTPCPGDFDADGRVTLTDVALLLSEFAEDCGANGCDTDSEGDGDVDLTDLAVLLSRFGTECP
jgi:hypothetical protein